MGVVDASTRGEGSTMKANLIAAAMFVVAYSMVGLLTWIGMAP